ncbi:hypothetical protein ACFL6C_06405 [Myxococcota bacterium]
MGRFPLTSFFVGLLSCGAVDGTVPDATVAPDASNLEDREAQARAEGLQLKRYDLNRDEQPDVFKFYRLEDDPKNPGNKLERLVRKELDINHDRKIDIIRFYDQDQQVTEERTDLDFDGRIDAVAHYKDGVLHHREIDVDYDTRPDVTKFYEEGKLTRIESDRDNDGRVDTWEYFVNGELDRVGTDTDRDGIADAWDRRRQPEQEGAAQDTATGSETSASSSENATESVD